MKVICHQEPLLLTYGSTLIPVWLSNHTSSQMWDDITCSYFILHFIGHVITYPCRDNKANLRDLIAVTGLVILLKLDSNRRFFARVTLKFDGWPRKIIRHVFYTTSSFNLCIISDPSGNSNWRYSPETAILSQNRRFFLAIWPSNLTYDLEKQ